MKEVQNLRIQAAITSLLRHGNFLVPPQLDKAKTDGVKNTVRRFLVSLVGELLFWSIASSSWCLERYTPYPSTNSTYKYFFI